jgi:hypothetical protein
MTGGEPLQFDRVEKQAADSVCSNCKRPLAGVYYQANTFTVCASCKELIEAEWNAGTTGARLGRAFIWGVAAAALGAGIYFGFTAITGFELSLIAIAVGYIVGRAIRAGSGNRGGPAYQWLAVFLTYTSIVFSYGLLAVKQSDDVTLAWVLNHFLFLYTVPFQDVSQNIIGLVIIGIGLYEAWVLNKPGSLSITGPYQVGGQSPSQPA